MPLTEFVLADRVDAQRVCDSVSPSDEFKSMDAKGVDPVKLGMLYAILADTEDVPDFVDDEPLCDGGEEGPWVMELPKDLVQRLARLDATQIGAAATKWANTEEFSSEYDDWTPELVHEVLSDLAKLCAQAVGANKSVLMWMSL